MPARLSICFRRSCERSIPLDLRDMCLRAGAELEDLVEEIIIGPESTQSRVMLQDYLCDQGLSALAERVSLSDCPLRGMPT